LTRNLGAVVNGNMVFQLSLVRAALFALSYATCPSASSNVNSKLAGHQLPYILECTNSIEEFTPSVEKSSTVSPIG
jgi:hypothetical protein